jgi:hypothetical protein
MTDKKQMNLCRNMVGLVPWISPLCVLFLDAKNGLAFAAFLAIRWRLHPRRSHSSLLKGGSLHFFILLFSASSRTIKCLMPSFTCNVASKKRTASRDMWGYFSTFRNAPQCAYFSYASNRVKGKISIALVFLEKLINEINTT